MDKILIIDNNKIDRETYKEYLSKSTNSNFIFIETDSARLGLELCKRENPSHILMSDDLNEISDEEFIKTLRETNKDVEIILFTNRDSKNDSSDILKTEAKKYIPKNELSTKNLFEAIFSKAGQEEETPTPIEKPLDQLCKDLRTPLNGMMGMAEMLSSTKLSKEQREYLQVMNDSSSSLLHIINDIFNGHLDKEEDSQPSSANILIVEDLEINQAVLTRMLKKMGHKSTIAENGRIAIEKFYKGQFDIILMDCSMPVLDGYEATQIIRKTDKIIPIVAVTASTLPEEKERCFSSGMNDYMSKPVNSNDVKQMIDKHIVKRKKVEKKPETPKHTDTKTENVGDIQSFISNSLTSSLRMISTHCKQLHELNKKNRDKKTTILIANIANILNKLSEETKFFNEYLSINKFKASNKEIDCNQVINAILLDRQEDISAYKLEVSCQNYLPVIYNKKIQISRLLGVFK